jgi:predicted transcriptional regulator of viral defense system
MQDSSVLTPEMVTLVAGIKAKLKDQGKAVFMPKEFTSLLQTVAPKNIRPKAIQQILEKAGVIRFQTLKSEDYKDVVRISVPSLNPSPFDYAVSLRAGAYLCHASAVNILGLTQQQPKTIYVNKEQSQKPASESRLTQEAIDRAFSNSQRRSRYIFRVAGIQIILLSGKSTGRAGVITDETSGLPITSLERTLIDITVRPRYAGGVFQVLQAFTAAIREVDISKMVALLKALNYRYPYHQSLGFYLERAGAPANVLQPLRNLGMLYDFHLDYSMASPGYDTSWRVFYPPGI